ncbi:MAG: protein of unknown function family [Dehalococcoidia bacterium]|nr:protein of unknown function family [Dehalococcoidia bacterium]
MTTIHTPATITVPERDQRSRRRPKVAVLYTRPASVLEDIARLLALADFPVLMPQDVETILKINISWQHWFPACSTTPWQLEGAILALWKMGYDRLIPSQNGTVVVDSREGEERNKHGAVLRKHGLQSVHLNDPHVKWVRYQPKAPMMVLDEIYPEGIHIPEHLIGKNILHLPTMKTHVFTTITGAMKNAFGGLLNFKRHWTHSAIHETLGDLLAIQQEIHPGIFALTDGTFAGEGPGPRAMRPLVKNTMIAGADQVAVDAVAAKMMGFDPMSLKFIRLAHERGLGCGDLREIEVVGEDISEVDWRFSGSENTLASRGQKLIYWGPLKPLENILLRSPIVPWAFLASNLYHNSFWLPFIGRSRVEWALKTEWGKLFERY